MAELTSQSMSIQSLYSMYRDNKLHVNRRYQRKLVWTLLEKQKLIESILKRYPVPAVLIAEQEHNAGTYEIIDGLQRLQALLSFVETAFPTLDGKYFDVERFPTAKQNADNKLFEPIVSVSTLDPKDISTYLDYALPLSVMRNASMTEIDDVFDRINTYGHRLSDQERRQAGVSSTFAEMVRHIACSIRGDVSQDVLPLFLMQSISIDLPKTKHGYQIKAEEVFWVQQGILGSTDLRDSMDEQCIADIAVCIIGGVCIERSKSALDKVYKKDDTEYERIATALQVHGPENFQKQFELCIDEIIKVCNANSQEKLRNVVFPKLTTNPFPSVFAVMFIAFYELLIKENLCISNYGEIKAKLSGLSNRISTGQKATSAEERRINIDQVKGLIGPCFIPNTDIPRVFSGVTIPEVDTAIRRSEIELPNYELKQGILTLSSSRSMDPQILDKIVKTIAAIANNGRQSAGKIIIGVADKEADARRVGELYGVTPQKVGERYVVGVNREAAFLSLTIEEYVAKIKNAIKDSGLTTATKMNVLSSVDYHNYYGLGILMINIYPQTELTFVNDELYWRSSDSTELATDPKTIAVIAKRF